MILFNYVWDYSAYFLLNAMGERLVQYGKKVSFLKFNRLLINVVFMKFILLMAHPCTSTGLVHLRQDNHTDITAAGRLLTTWCYRITLQYHNDFIIRTSD